MHSYMFLEFLKQSSNKWWYVSMVGGGGALSKGKNIFSAIMDLL